MFYTWPNPQATLGHPLLRERLGRKKKKTRGGGGGGAGEGQKGKPRSHVTKEAHGGIIKSCPLRRLDLTRFAISDQTTHFNQEFL